MPLSTRMSLDRHSLIARSHMLMSGLIPQRHAITLAAWAWRTSSLSQRSHASFPSLELVGHPNEIGTVITTATTLVTETETEIETDHGSGRGIEIGTETAITSETIMLVARAHHLMNQAAGVAAMIMPTFRMRLVLCTCHQEYRNTSGPDGAIVNHGILAHQTLRITL